MIDATAEGARTRPDLSLSRLQDRILQQKALAVAGTKLRLENMRRVAAAGLYGSKVYSAGVARLRGLP